MMDAVKVNHTYRSVYYYGRTIEITSGGQQCRKT
jgi:hypothetical protein